MTTSRFEHALFERLAFSQARATALLNMVALTEAEKSRICEMAWEDRTPFEAIKMQFGLTEGQTIDLMRDYMKKSSFVMWRKRMSGLTVKHAALRNPAVTRHKANNRSPSR